MIAPQGLNIQINKGTDFVQNLELKNADKTPFDLSGYTGVSRVRKFPEAKVSHSFTVGITSSTGVISLGMTVGVTTSLTEGRNYYDVVIKQQYSKMQLKTNACETSCYFYCNKKATIS